MKRINKIFLPLNISPFSCKCYTGHSFKNVTKYRIQSINKIKGITFGKVFFINKINI